MTDAQNWQQRRHILLSQLKTQNKMKRVVKISGRSFDQGRDKKVDIQCTVVVANPQYFHENAEDESNHLRNALFDVLRKNGFMAHEIKL